MQHDEMIWSVINNSFCSFKSRITPNKNFCRNKYNSTGLCDRMSCPLANSKYATVREEEGQIYLCVKTAERAHAPRDQWERVKLPRDYARAVEEIEQVLEHWNKGAVMRCKQRLLKITQYLIRTRKIEKTLKPKLKVINKKVERRENRREVKALKAARISSAIEGELLDRLKNGAYGDVYNFPETEYQRTLTALENENQEEEEEEGELEYVEGDSSSSEEEDEEDEKVLIEYEKEEVGGFEGGYGDTIEW